MNAKQLRRQRLMPRGIPRWIRCYDNGGKSADRYTVCFTGKSGAACGFGYRAMSEAPFHPQGVGLWGDNHIAGHPIDTRRGWPPALGRKCHLGRRIRFQDLPADCRKLVRQDYIEIWRLK